MKKLNLIIFGLCAIILNSCNAPDYSWIYGTWYCDIPPYGTMVLKINEYQAISIDDYGRDKGQYTIDGDILRVKFTKDGGAATTYKLDFSRHRIGAGDGYYFYKEDEGYEDYEYYYEDDEDNTYIFNSAYDVGTYLMSHNFVSEDGSVTVTIRNLNIYANGQCLTGAINVSSFNQSSAIITAESPYTGRFKLKVDCASETLIDLNSGEIYYTD